MEHFPENTTISAGREATKTGHCVRLTNAEQSAMLGSLNTLRVFAKSLTRDLDRADDLVQETLLRAITKMHQFQPGTNMQAWLMTILRNLFLSKCRKGQLDRDYKASLSMGPRSAPPEQYSGLYARELNSAVRQLPTQQREALLLVSMGSSYDEAAALCHCPVGTLKSRANRGRRRLSKLMSIDHPSDFGADRRGYGALCQ
jgi:RNA polymerase sigma-70 factor, ECF subfamily